MTLVQDTYAHDDMALLGLLTLEATILNEALARFQQILINHNENDEHDRSTALQVAQAAAHFIAREIDALID